MAAVFSSVWVGVCAAAPAQDGPNEVFLQLKAPLDEPRRFCFDVEGAPPETNWDAPLQAHTCKEGYVHDDGLFDLAASREGRLRLVRFDRCLTVRDGRLYGERCSESAGQAWRMAPDGRVSPASAPDQCVTIGPTTAPAGHPPEVVPGWVMRSLALEGCSDAMAERQQWTLAHSRQPIR
jgi:hypothetical protein